MKLYSGKGGKKTKCDVHTRTDGQSFEKPFRCLYCLTESCKPREIFPDLIPLSAFAVSWLFLAAEVASPCTQIVALYNCTA